MLMSPLVTHSFLQPYISLNLKYNRVGIEINRLKLFSDKLLSMHPAKYLAQAVSEGRAYEMIIAQSCSLRPCKFVNITAIGLQVIKI
jgi:hypothetical protein